MNGFGTALAEIVTAIGKWILGFVSAVGGGLIGFVKDQPVIVAFVLIVITGALILYWFISALLGSAAPGILIARRMKLIRRIADLGIEERAALKAKNQPDLVDTLVREAGWTIEAWEARKKGKTLRRVDQDRMFNNVKILLESYKGLKEGGRFYKPTIDRKKNGV